MNDNTVSSDLIRGHIDTIILRSLYFGDRYGYDIIKEIEQKTDGEYKLKQPTLYSCLKRLEDQGFTSSYWGAKSMGGRKKYYTLTDMGRQLFIKNQADWQRSRQIIEKLIEGEEFEINAARPRLFEKSFKEESENIFDSTGANASGNQIFDIEKTLLHDFENDKNAQDKTAFEIEEKQLNKTYENFDTTILNTAEQEIASTGSPMHSDKAEAETEYESNFIDTLLSSDKTSQTEATEKFDNFDNFVLDEHTETEEEQRYDNFEAVYESNPDFFKQQERFDNFSGYIPSPEPNQPSIFIREETEDDAAVAETYESAEALRQNMNFTKSSYELDNSGGFVEGFIEELETDSDTNEQDSQKTSIENFYFDQKDKPSYIDDVSETPYYPATVREPEDNNNFFCEDELPYAEHLLKEYGAGQNEVANANTDIESPDLDKSLKTSDVNELPYEFYEKACENTDEKINLQNTEHTEELNDVNELPYFPNGETNETYEDDGVEIPYSEILEEQDKENDIIKGFLKYDNSSLGEMKDAEIIERQYHAALSRLIRKQKPKYSSDPFVQNKLEKTAASAAQMGDEVIIRKHTDTVKEYNSENYFYNNRLRLWQYGIVFIIMLLETALTFAICELFIHKAVITMTELWVYIFGVIVSLALPTIAFALAQHNLDKRKKADLDLKSLMIFRILLCVLLLLIIFLINSYLKMLTSKFSDYLATLIYPMVLTTNIITSGFIFNKLYKSKKFKCQ